MQPLQRCFFMDDGQFVERLEKECDKKGVSLSDFLSKMDLSSSNGTYWRKSGYIPEGKILLKMAEFLEVSIDYLVTGKTYSPPYRIEKPAIINQVAATYTPPYGYNDAEKSADGRETGSFECQIRELKRRFEGLERQNTVSNEIIENQYNQLLNEMKKMAEKIEKMPKQLNLNKKNR